MSAERDQKKQEPTGIEFLDFVFTVAMSVGLLPEPLNIPHLKGVLSEPWLMRWSPPSCPEAVNFCTFALGLLTLILSWFGYHASMKRRPLKDDTVCGMVRFVLDVMLVIVYAVIMLQFRYPDRVLLLLVAVYWVYFVWDMLKILEYWKDPDEQKLRAGGALREVYRRQLVSLYAAGYFTAVYVFSIQTGILCIPAAIVVAILLTVFYRVHKICPIWPKIGRLFHGAR